MKNSITWKGIALSALVIFFAAACKKQAHEHAGGDVYTCPMHPEVIQPGPGKCPVCGMNLVKKSAAAQVSSGLMLNDSQVRLANITTRPARIMELGQSLLVNGRLAVDEDRSEVVSSRVAGRIEKLYIKETGRTLRAGEPFLELYSESLLTYQREYLLALDQERELGDGYESFVKSARKKLLRYGLTESQVENLGRDKKLSERVIFAAPAGGVVTNLSVAEGQYVDEGTLLYRVEDIRRLWVEAELYPGEADRVKTGDRVALRIAGWEHQPLEVLVTFLTPEYRENTQLTVMRAMLDNSAMNFQPGMQAQVLVRHSVRKALALPVDAVIRGQGGSHIFVMTGKNTFERRNVTTGLEDVDLVEITNGLNEGEQVAVTGAYLLHSEMILKGVGAEAHKH